MCYTIGMKQDAPFTKTRLYIDDSFTGGKAIDLPGHAVHHLRTVLRLEEGAQISVFNGRDGEWLARLNRLGKKDGSAILVEQIRKYEPGPDVWLLFAPLKKDATDFVVEKATELGASAIWPVLTKHTQTRRVNVERLARTAEDAAAQCERLDVPAIRNAAPLDDLLATWPEDRRLVVCVERGGSHVLPAARAMDALPAGPAAILIGPEGGFDAEELDKILNLDFAVPVSLGPRILRAETAALAALTCFQAMTGDW